MAKSAAKKAKPIEQANGKLRLIKVAMRMFADKGYDGITVRDISAAADVSVGLINHHFGSKQSVEFTENWINRHIDDWDLTKAYMRRALLEGSDWGAGLFDRFYNVARTAVDRSDADGNIRPDVDRLWLPLLVMYLELGTLLLEPYVERVLGKSGFDRELWRRRHKAYIDLIYRGVRPDNFPVS